MGFVNNEMAKAQSNSISDKIKAAYLKYVEENGELPSDVYAFCAANDLKDTQFFQNYEDFHEVHTDLWTDMMRTTLTSLAIDEEFGQFSGREQLLAFYYTHIEILKPYRTLLVLDKSRIKVPIPLPRFMLGYKERFMDFAKRLVDFATKNKEIANRKFINSQYDKALWSQLYWLIQFWINDESEGFELTDAAIEKAVNLSFELTRPGPLDSVIDFAKFVYQNR